MEWLLLLFVPTFAAVTRALDYSDLETLGVACRPRDTCSGNVNRTFSTSNCECDNWCEYFDDCCVDRPTTRNHNRVHRRLGITCLPLDLSQGVYAVGRCKSSWSGSDVVRRKCENLDDFSDPLISLPSTDTHTSVTYRNHYCAECNSASLQNLSSWDATLTCNSLEDINTLFNNITQDFIVGSITRLGSSWGAYQWNESLGRMAFYPCEVSFQLPHRLTHYIRYCRPHLISSCSANWRRRAVRSNCLAYMAVIYVNDQAYRNAHCALCNRVSINNRTCDLAMLTARRKPSLSFTLLLDVNSSDGNSVGETDRCPSGEKYDPFFKKCRALVCALPGHVFRDGRCVPQ